MKMDMGDFEVALWEKRKVDCKPTLQSLLSSLPTPAPITDANTKFLHSGQNLRDMIATASRLASTVTTNRMIVSEVDNPVKSGIRLATERLATRDQQL